MSTNLFFVFTAVRFLERGESGFLGLALKTGDSLLRSLVRGNRLARRRRRSRALRGRLRRGGCGAGAA
ncbi:hypothetical protein ADT71_14670 [Novosphingobium sp. ST904]|nr:hypothetical protein ADT71_14670 [Novosphingobium sp. ST904]